MPKVLIIEDDPLVSRMYQQSFSFEGFETVMASNGLEGVSKAKTEKPDIIFCDIMMPKMNGLEVLDALKNDTSTQNITIVMLTNLSGVQDSKTAMDKGAYAYIVKSEFKPKEIAQKANDFLMQVAAKSGQPVAVTPAIAPAPVVTPAPTTTPAPITPAVTPTPAPTVVPKPVATPAATPETNIKPTTKVINV